MTRLARSLSTPGSKLGSRENANDLTVQPPGRVDGSLTADVQADFKRVGLDLRRKAKGSRTIAVADSGTLEWVDPVVGTRLRHQFASGSELNLEGDVGGFGAGSEFSTNGFDVNAFGTTMRSVVGFRALSVDYSQIGAHGRSGLDWIQRGPILGVAFRWWQATACEPWLDK